MSMKSALTVAEIEDFSRNNPEWTLQKGKLIREWVFKDFVAAMLFVNHIAALAEAAEHHPDIDIRYNRVFLGLVSHDAGGITERDTAMASRISAAFAAR
jgi:4a-hydroxytetrahydrobiopterin dehydratase